MARNGVITRRDIITDQALEFGGVYAKNVEKAISANKKMVTGAKALHKVFLDINSVQGNSAFNAYLQNTAVLMQQISTAVALQNTALRENQNIVNQLTTTQVTANQARLEQLRIDREVQRLGQAESQRKRSDIALSEAERRQTEALIRVQNREARELANQASAYVQLQRRRNEAQRALGDLLSAERLNTTEIQRAQREFQILDRRLQAVDAAVRNYSRNVGNYQSAFRGLNSTMRELISTFGLASGIALFGMIVKDIFGTIKDFDRQLIAVGKTTNISGEDLKQFGREVVELGEKLNGVSIEGLLKSSEVAGQLGVRGTQNILKFSEAVEKLKLTSNIISDEQVQNFAKFIEVSSDSFENADRLASVITQLGNNFASTEAEVLANATEIQKGTAVYKTSAQGILALGAATSALGSEAESSRSAIQSTFAILNNAIALNRNLDKVLKITGLSQAQLKEEFGDDATKVFVKFVKGLNTAKNEGQNLSLVLNELGIKEKRAFTVVGSLAANYELLERAMQMASEEYKNNVALNKEVEAASQSVSSILGDIKDKFDAYILSTNDANDGTKTITNALKFLRDNLSAIITGLLKYGSVIVSFLLIQKSWNFLTVLWTAISTAANAAQVRFAISTGIGTRAVLAQAAAVRAATAAQAGMNVAMAATPWGLILAFVGAAVVAYQVFNDELSDHERQLQKIKIINDGLAEDAKYQSEYTDAYLQKRFKGIEDDIRLRRAQGENSAKLDQEELDNKKAIVELEIATVDRINKNTKKNYQESIDISKKKIEQLDKELEAMTRLDEVSGRTSARNAERETFVFLKSRLEGNVKLKQQSVFKMTALEEEEKKRLGEILSDFNKDKAVKDAQFRKEESEKEKKEREKRRKEYLAAMKQAENDDFALREFRLKNAIDLNKQIVDDERRSLDERLDSEYDKNQEDIGLSNETLEHKLKNISLYDDSVRDLTQAEINTLVAGGEIKRNLLNSERLLVEQHAAEIIAINKKREEDLTKIAESRIAFAQLAIDSQISEEERKINEAIEFENRKFVAINDLESMNQAEREAAVKKHEEKIFEIKKKFALDTLKIQIKGLEDELAKNDARDESEQISAGKRKEIANQLQLAKTNLTEIEKQNYIESLDEKLRKEEQFKETVIEMSENIKSALINLTNAVFEARISNIDNEIQKNDDYYNSQIEQAEGNSEQQNRIREEQEKKREELEKKKRKEQQKQAIFNRAMQATAIITNTSLAVISALAQVPKFDFGISASTIAALYAGIGAVELAAVLTAPLPKYKGGRKGGPAEFAEVGDGLVNEVVHKEDGSFYITPNRPTLTYLEKGDSVYSSVAEFQKMMASSSKSSLAIQNAKMGEFQNSKQLEDKYGSETLQVMRETLKAIKNQKQNINIHPAKIDFGHEIWKSKNTSWRS